MTRHSQKPSSRDSFAGPMVQLPCESEIISPRATGQWVPRIKRGMTGVAEVNA